MLFTPVVGGEFWRGLAELLIGCSPLRVVKKRAYIVHESRADTTRIEILSCLIVECPHGIPIMESVGEYEVTSLNVREVPCL